jgi:hypothetical protein
MRAALRTCIAALAGLGFLAAGLPAPAQIHLLENQPQEPQWATLHMDRISIGVYGEAFSQYTTTANGSGTYRETRTFIGPDFGLEADGSIYHPNLIAYRLSLDGAYGQTTDTFSGSAGNGSSKETQFLGFFTGEMQILDSKPFHARLDANYSHSYQDYDFFNRVYVDTWRYGGAAYYATGPWRLSAQLRRVTEDATGNFVPWTLDTRLALFDVTHERSAGSTYLSAAVSDFVRTDSGVETTGQDYVFTLSDEERFGSRNQYHATVAGTYDHLESSIAPTELYSTTASLQADHTERLTSISQASYSHNTFGEAVNDIWTGSSIFQHRLFDSLISSLTLQGYYYTATTEAAEQDSWQVGVTPGVQYLKSLSSSSSLSAYESLGFLHTDIRTTGGIIQINAEPQTFGVHGPPDYFTLNQPNVIASSIIISATPTVTATNFIPGIDYEVVPNGQLTMIHRLPGSTLPDSVFVSYQFDSGSSGSFDTINDAAGIRFSFFNDLWSVYTRLNLIRNSGTGNVVVQDLTDIVVGTEIRWRRLIAGAEYEIYDSSLSPYDAARFFQLWTFTPDDYSTANISLTESFISYGGPSTGRNEQNYRAVLRYTRRLSHHLSVNLETGVNQRVGDNVDETLAVFRPEFNYIAGSFSATLGYNFGYDEYLSSTEHVVNRGYIRLRKQF